MQQSSAALQEAVQKTYVKIDQAFLVRDGAVIRELEAIGGSVDAARDAEQTRRCQIDVADPTGELTPYQLDDETAPFGTELVVRTGARIPVMTEEVLIAEDAAGWNAGTRSNLIVDGNGDLVLGYS